MPSRPVLAKIHIAKKDLGYSDDEYRSILQVRYGKDSAAKISQYQANDLINHFMSMGWKPKRGKSKKSSPRYADPQLRKVVAMWITLHKEGVVRNGSHQALLGYVKRLTGVDDLKWCTGSDINTIIESLKKWGERKGVKLG